MRKRKRIWTLLLLIVFLCSTGRYLWHLYETAASDDSYSRARSLADSGTISAAITEETMPEQDAPPGEMVWIPEPVEGDSNLEDMKQLELDSLRRINPDVAGWIRIPDTPIDYPVVQGRDNEYYLDYTWDGQRNASGAIFLETTNQRDMTEFHTILYGHNMRSGSMFASLREFTTLEYWQKHPYVYLLTETGAFRYEIYASYLADVDGMTYQLKQQKDTTKELFLGYTAEKSVIDTGIVPAVSDRILTLSTCSGVGYSTRWVIHARLPMIEVPA